MTTLQLNKETIAFALGLIGLLTVGWNVTSYFQDINPSKNAVVHKMDIQNVEQDGRITRLEDNTKRFDESLIRLTDKTDQLSNAMTKLTVTIERAFPVKRAEFPMDSQRAQR